MLMDPGAFRDGVIRSSAPGGRVWVSGALQRARAWQSRSMTRVFRRDQRTVTRMPSVSVSGGCSTTVWPADSPLEDLPFALVALPELHRLQAGTAVFDDEHGPSLAAPEERADRDLQHVVVAPDDDAHLDAIAVAERAGGSGGSSRSMITLTRCSSTPSAETFMKPDGSTRRTRPCSGWSPPHCIDRARRRAWRYPHGVGREQVGHDLELTADRQSRATVRRPATTDSLSRRRFSMTPSTGAHDLDAGRPPPSRRLQPGARELQLVFRPGDRELGGARALPRPCCTAVLRGFEIVAGDRAGFASASLPRERRSGARQSRRGAVALGLRLTDGRARGFDRGARAPRACADRGAALRPAPAAPGSVLPRTRGRPARARCACSGRPPAPRRRSARAPASRRLRRWSPASGPRSTGTTSTAIDVGPHRDRHDGGDDARPPSNRRTECSSGGDTVIPGSSARRPDRAGRAGAAPAAPTPPPQR